jgi:hypothetical protein
MLEAKLQRQKRGTFVFIPYMGIGEEQVATLKYLNTAFFKRKIRAWYLENED